MSFVFYSCSIVGYISRVFCVYGLLQFVLPFASANLPAAEMQALKDLYEASNGPNWSCCQTAGSVAWNFTNVSANPCVDDWQGITCNHPSSLQYFVSNLVLHDLSLQGTIPNSIGNFPQLVEFNAYSNSITGTIPPSFGNLSKLQDLFLEDNSFVGSIPHSLGNLSSLLYLQLYDNFLTNTIPTSLGNLSQLQNFYVFSNSLVGAMPSSLGSLLQVVYFEAGDNSLTGTVPCSLGELPVVVELDLHGNSLTGIVSSCLGNLKSLQKLYLYQNLFSHTIPVTFGNLSNLQFLEVYDNSLTGEVPSSLQKLSKLVALDLFENRLTGVVPTWVGDITTLVYVNMYSNQLTGSMPTSLGKLSNLQYLELYDNSITGTLPSVLSALTNLVYLEMYENSLSGAIPSEIGSLTDVQLFYFYLNCLTGSIPSSLGSLISVQYFDVGDNHLEGPVPLSLVNCTNMVQIRLDSNKLSGSLTGLFNGDTQLYLSNIQVNNNQFTGTIPEDIFDIAKLNTFVASTNCFGGVLPSNVCAAESMTSLVLNGLSSATNCRNVLFPGISQSYVIEQSVSGGIPVCLFQLPSLISLHLSGNGFSGSLPASDDISPTLLDVDLSHNSLLGELYMALQTKQWSQLDLSYNRFSGTLLSNFAAQYTDTALTLSNNRLSGRVPGSMLEVLNISILVSNMFSCLLDGSDLPSHDSDKRSYQCGSTNVNIELYVWTALTVSLFISGLILWVRWEYVSTQWRKCNEWLEHSNPRTSNSNSLGQAGSSFEFILFLTMKCTVFIIIILLPVYCVLSHVDGTYTYEYAYETSAAFLSGIRPFVVDCCLWVLFIVLVLFCWFRYVGRDNDHPKSVAIVELKFNSSPAVATSNETTLIYLLFIVVNLFVVIGANIAYVYVVLYGDNSLLLLEQVLLSFFKVFWNSFMLPRVLAWVATYVVSPRFSKSIGFEYSFAVTQVSISILNTIIIPVFVVMLVSPDCFYNLIVAAPAVTSTYTTSICVESFVNGACDQTLLQQSASYNPPFTYNYQCSSSFITYYSPAFVSTCIISTFLVPMLKVVGIYGLKRLNPDNCFFRLLDLALPRILKPLSGDSNEGTGQYFRIIRILVSLFTNLGLLMTFGVVFPPLAISLAVTIAVIIFSAKLELGRFIHRALEQQKVNLLELVKLECSVVNYDVLLTNVVWLLIVVSFLFYTLFLFDTLGDAVGFGGAVWVLVAVPLGPLVLYMLVQLILRQYPSNSSYSRKDSNNVEMNASIRLGLVLSPFAAMQGCDEDKKYTT